MQLLNIRQLIGSAAETSAVDPLTPGITRHSTKFATLYYTTKHSLALRTERESHFRPRRLRLFSLRSPTGFQLLPEH